MLGSRYKRWGHTTRGSSVVVGFPNAVKTSLVKLGQCNGDRQFLQLLFSGLQIASQSGPWCWILANLTARTNLPGHSVYVSRPWAVAVARVDE